MSTILIVDDDPWVRGLARDVLQAEGYQVLDAHGAAEALHISDRHTGPIDLLLTDVVMPEMNGPQLAARLRPRRPGMKVVYMSGFAEEYVGECGVRPEEPFIAKPLTIMYLSAKVREVLAERVG